MTEILSPPTPPNNDVRQLNIPVRSQILVVDDRRENLFAMEQMLKPLKVKIVTAQSGHEALSLLLREDFSVVLLDVQMPKMDGFETAELMQANEQTKNVPIIFVTAVSKEPVFVFKGYQVGGVDYLFKPVEPEVLTQKVQVFIQLHNEKTKLSYETEARRKAQQELLTAKKQLEQYFEAIPLGLLVLNKEGHPTYSNHAAKRIISATDLNQDLEKFSKSFRVYVSGTDELYPTEELPFYKALQGSSAYASDMEIRQNGKILPLEVWASPVFNEKKEVVSTIGAFADIADRKDLEDQLRQAQKLESVGRLAGGVAHDLNNMLMVISGYAQILLTQCEDKSYAEEGLKEILNASNRAAEVTQQLLAFSRRQILKPVVLNINYSVGEIEKMLNRLIGEDILFIVDLESNLPKIKVDPTQLQQILMNLVINSRDSMPKGGKLILTTERRTIEKDNVLHYPEEIDPGQYVELTVSDTGMGMDKETIKHIFEPFFTTKEKGKGTGLGLSTVYGIVRQSGGFISVYSEVGKGTTFRILFPVTSSEARPSRQTSRKIVNTRGSETILLVEDEKALQQLVSRHLESEGYTVYSWTNPKDAIHFVKTTKEKMDLLITDVILPEINGKEMADEILGVIPGLKVIYSSGYNDELIAHHGVLEKGVELISKPYNLSDLSLRIRSVLDR